MARKNARHDEVLEALLKFQANTRWADKHPEKFRKYVDRFVAVDNRTILAVSTDEHELYRKYGKRRGVYIDYIWPPDLPRVL